MRLSAMTGGNEAIRSTHVIVLLLIGCGGGRVPASSAVKPDRSRTTATRAEPDSLFGIVLRKPFNPLAFTRHTCLGARDFAYRPGPYSIVTDDILFEPPHEHEDTADVLAALDSFTVCVGETRELNATAVVTLSDSVVGNAHIFWPDEGRAPQYNRLLELVKASYGEPLHNRHGVEFWSADTMDIYINHRSFYNEAPSLNLSDARVCERFERLVHREHPAPASVNPQGNHCWVQPDTGSIAVADSIARASEPPPGTRVRYQMAGDSTWAEGRVMDLDGCIAIVPDDQRAVPANLPNAFVTVWFSLVQRLQLRGREHNDTTWTTIPEASVRRFHSCRSD